MPYGVWTFDTVPYQLRWKKNGKGTKYVDGRDNSGLCWMESYQIRRQLLTEFLKNGSLVKAFEFSLINLTAKKHANQISWQHQVTLYMQKRTAYTEGLIKNHSPIMWKLLIKIRTDVRGYNWVKQYEDLKKLFVGLGCKKQRVPSRNEWK